MFGFNALEVLAFKTGNPENPVNAIPPRATATLRFEGSRAGGTDGCNRYSAPYDAASGKLRAVVVAAWPTACETGGLVLARKLESPP